MGRKSRNKGAGFERHIAKLFSEALGLTFRRTPLSGGWAQAAEVAAGDIVCVDDSAFAFCIECKKAEGWRTHSLLTDNHKWFDNWWAQVVEECPSGKIPLLVFSRNYLPVFVATKVVGSIDIPHVTTNVAGERVVVYLLSHFISSLVKGRGDAKE